MMWLPHGATTPWATKYRVSLGPDQWPTLPPPTWREHLTSLGHRLETQEDYDRVYRQRSLMPEELDQLIDGYWWEDYWEDYWELYESPQAKAHQLLEDLDLDCDPKAPGSKVGTILFTEWGGHPGSSERWVDLKGDLSVSIFQARLIEGDLPIRLVLGLL